MNGTQEETVPHFWATSQVLKVATEEGEAIHVKIQISQY